MCQVTPNFIFSPYFTFSLCTPHVMKFYSIVNFPHYCFTVRSQANLVLVYVEINILSIWISFAVIVSYFIPVSLCGMSNGYFSSAIGNFEATLDASHFLCVIFIALWTNSILRFSLRTGSVHLMHSYSLVKLSISKRISHELFNVSKFILHCELQIAIIK